MRYYRYKDTRYYCSADATHAAFFDAMALVDCLGTARDSEPVRIPRGTSVMGYDRIIWEEPGGTRRETSGTWFPTCTLPGRPSWVETECSNGFERVSSFDPGDGKPMPATSHPYAIYPVSVQALRVHHRGDPDRSTIVPVPATTPEQAPGYFITYPDAPWYFTFGSVEYPVEEFKANSLPWLAGHRVTGAPVRGAPVRGAPLRRKRPGAPESDPGDIVAYI